MTSIKKALMIALLFQVISLSITADKAHADEFDFFVSDISLSYGILTFDTFDFLSSVPLPGGISLNFEYTLNNTFDYVLFSQFRAAYNSQDYFRDASGALLPYADFGNTLFSRYWYYEFINNTGVKVLLEPENPYDADFDPLTISLFYSALYRNDLETALFHTIEPSTLFLGTRADSPAIQSITSRVSVRHFKNPQPLEDHRTRNGYSGIAEIEYGLPILTESFLRFYMAAEFKTRVFDLNPEKILNTFNIQFDSSASFSYFFPITEDRFDIPVPTIQKARIFPEGVGEYGYSATDLELTAKSENFLRFNLPAIYINNFIPAVYLGLNSGYAQSWNNTESIFLLSAGGGAYLDITLGGAAVKVGAKFYYDFTKGTPEPNQFGILLSL
jgi:hypothetical protein